MKSKIKIKLLLIIIISVFMAGMTYNVVYADETADAQLVAERKIVDTDLTESGIYVAISLSIQAASGKVTAVARNDFTIGNSVVQVYVEIYSSDSQTYYENMELESINYTNDLNIFKEISTSAYTNGETKYWVARVRYKRDNKDWHTATTDAIKLNGAGQQIQ